MEYKIENTTKKQRAEIVKEAFEISITGNENVPSEEATKYLQDYVNGISELDEVERKIIELYKKD